MKPSDQQIGGSHYKKMAIQPMHFCLANNLNAGQTHAIKYITRYKDKNGIQDLRKAIHCIELLIEFEESQYGASIPVSREDQSSSGGRGDSLDNAGEKTNA